MPRQPTSTSLRHVKLQHKTTISLKVFSNFVAARWSDLRRSLVLVGCRGMASHHAQDQPTQGCVLCSRPCLGRFEAALGQYLEGPSPPGCGYCPQCRSANCSGALQATLPSWLAKSEPNVGLITPGAESEIAICPGPIHYNSVV